jgi:hypothetical protein
MEHVITFFGPDNLGVGVARRMDSDGVANILSDAAIGDTKACRGGISPALYANGQRRKLALVSITMLVLDFDESGVDDVVEALGRYSLFVHSTFSDSEENPRCRAYIELTGGGIDVATYDPLHTIVRAVCRRAGLPPDEGAKDASRLSYLPVRPKGAPYKFHRIDGELLDAQRILAAHPPPPRAVVPPPKPEHRDRYVEGALRRAADAVGAASPGVRHYTLCKEAFCLARLGISTGEIERALLPAFVSAAGERREHEGRRTIADAIRARRGAA